MSSAGRSTTPGLDEPGAIKDHAGTPSRYLTDGVNLYRYVGTIPSPIGPMIGLENCHSLDVTLCPGRDLHALRLRSVTPAAGTSKME